MRTTQHTKIYEFLIRTVRLLNPRQLSEYKEQGKDELLPQEALEFIPMEGYWVARIEKAKAKRIVSKRMKGKRHVHAE